MAEMLVCDKCNINLPESNPESKGWKRFFVRRDLPYMLIAEDIDAMRDGINIHLCTKCAKVFSKWLERR